MALGCVLVPVRRRNRHRRVIQRRQARIQLLAEGIAEEHTEGQPAESQVATLREWAPVMGQEDWDFFERTYREHYEDLTSRLSAGKVEMERLEQTFRRNQKTSQARLEMNNEYRRPKSDDHHDSSEMEAPLSADPILSEFQHLLDDHSSSTTRRTTTE